MTSHDRELLNAVLRNDFETFIQSCFETVNPGEQFEYNWHIAAIAHVLEQVRLGKITRLIINLPPRYLKSVIVSVAFPAFVLGHDPSRKIIAISYGNDLSLKFARDFRSVVTSRRYRCAFPQMRIARSVDDELETSGGGFRRATSVSGTLTGIGGNLIIIDDPQKALDAQSEARRESLNQWPANTLLSRLDNKKTDAIVLVQQRVHDNDLSGNFMQNSNGWYVLSLPAIAEADERIPIGKGRYYLRKAGKPLHEAREPLAVLKQMQLELGSSAFAAQYQQRPVPPGGAMFKREWLVYYDDLPTKTGRAKIIQAWDTAGKEGEENDWSVGTTWLVINKNYYLIDVTRGRYDYPRLKRTAIALAERFKPDLIMVEDAYTGTALGQELKDRRLGLAVRLVPVTRGKFERAYVHTGKFEAGRVLFPRRAAFLPELEAELLSFPHHRNDDQVDSISLALTFEHVRYGMMDVV